MKRTISLILVLVLASMANGARFLTVDGENVDSIALCVGRSYTIEVVSDDEVAYLNNIGFDDCNSLGIFYHVETKPAAGDDAAVSPIDQPDFCGYEVIADDWPWLGTHFVFQYEPLEIGETVLMLYGHPLQSRIEEDSLHITIEPCPFEPAFTYQGWLRDSNIPSCGYYDFEFKLYNAPDASDQQGCTVIEDDVYVEDGIFTVELDFADCDPNVFNGDARWLEISVRPGSSNNPADFVTLSPRQEVTPTPYAIYAQTAGSDNDWMVSGNNMYSIPSGNVGIGTTSPTGSGGIISTLKAGNVFSPDLVLDVQKPDWADGEDVQIRVGDLVLNSRKGIASNNIEADNQNTNGNLVLAAKNRIYFNTETPGSDVFEMMITNDGNVGIGTTSPYVSRLHVYSGTDALNTLRVENNNSSYAPLVIVNPSGWGIYDTATKHYFAGNVGIGTKSPGVKLDVAGWVRADGYLANDIIFQKDGQKLWRMFEDENGLYLESLKTGKLYSFVLQEIETNLTVSNPNNLEQAVRDLQAENESLKERIEALERTMQQRESLTMGKEVQ